MKTPALAFLCALACMACAKPLTTLSDGQPGYAVQCEARIRCIEDIALLCQGKSHMIISERIRDPSRTPNWPSPGQSPTNLHTSYAQRYWIEARCDK